MKIHKIFLSVLFSLVAVFAFSKGAYAAGLCNFGESTPANCCTNLYAGGDCTDVGKNWYVNGTCVTNATVVSAISSATSVSKQYNCVTGATQCRTGYIDCSGTCKVAETDDGVNDGVDADGSLPDSAPYSPCTSSVLNRSGYNQCTGACNSECASGYEKNPSYGWTYNSACRATCPTGEVRSSDGTTCLSLDKVAQIMAKAFGSLTLSNLMSTYSTIIINMTTVPSYYLLTSQGTSVAPSPFAGQRLYQFGHGAGDTTDKVRLESDYADMAWALDPANPAYAILQEIINEWTGLNMCTVDSDCTVTGETCVGAFCQALGGEGDACTDNFDCAAGLYCDVATHLCAPIDGGSVDPSGIVPGLEDQILTTINDAGTLKASWEDPAIVSTVAQFRGLTASGVGFDAAVRSSGNPYYAMSQKCATAFTGSHMCSTSEIVNNYSTNNATISAQTGAALISNGPPGYTVFANDCNGWTINTAIFNSTPAFAAVWSFGSKNGSLQTCDNAANTAIFQIACCGE
jgi:hypothetical protein